MSTIDMTARFSDADCRKFCPKNVRRRLGEQLLTFLLRQKLINCDDIEIVKKYNTEIRGMYNYYRIADNASVLNNFYYVMKFSMLKTFAAKYKTNIGKIRNKYGHQRFGVKYQTKNGSENIMSFYDEGFKKNKTAILQSSVDIVPIDYSANSKTSLVERIKAGKLQEKRLQRRTYWHNGGCTCAREGIKKTVTGFVPAAVSCCLLHGIFDGLVFLLYKTKAHNLEKFPKLRAISLVEVTRFELAAPTSRT